MERKCIILSNSSLSSFAVAVLVGVCVASLPRLIAPSDTYISDTLALSSQDIYITSQPSSMSVVAGDRVNYIISTNISDGVSYHWQYSADTGLNWSDVDMLGSDQAIFVFTALTSMDGLFYRCSVEYDDSYIYSAPFMLSVAEAPESEEAAEAPEPQETTEHIEIESEGVENDGE